jgi:hypothetical protein
MSDVLVCSMHIQKTAGKSLLAVLRQAYDQVLVGHEMPERDRLKRLWHDEREVAERVQVVHGHMPWGFHSWFDRHYAYIGFVREPVDRVVSYYYFCRSEPTHNRHGLAHMLTLDEWVKHNPDLCVDNAMTRYFAGRITDLAPRPVKVHPAERSAMLAEAIENIQSDFPVVGVVEDMERSLEMLKVYFGWPAELEMPRVNANRARPELDSVPAATRDRIRELNDLDRALYDYCRQRLERDYPNFCGFASQT